MREISNRDCMAAATRLQTVLRAEFARRKEMNPRYSLRAFASSVQIEHSTLSQLLRGRRSMTWKSIRTLASRMRWTGRDVLEIARDKDRFNSREVARRLAISVDKVNVALTDLCLFGLLEFKGE